MDDEELVQRVVDRYDIDELTAVLGLSVEELAWAFIDNIKEKQHDGTIDV